MRTVLFAAALLAVGAAAAQRPERPNFIYIMADDQGYGDLGVQGHPYIRTPNIDRIAREGVRLTDFYAQPFCGPSRAALITGSYPARVSLAFNHIPRARTGIHPNEITIAEILKTRGYATAIIGKWHLGDAPEFLPTRHGFDYWLGLPYSNDMWPYHPKILERADEDERMRAARKRARYTGYAQSDQTYPLDWFPPLPLMRNEEVIELNPTQELLTETYTDEAIRFMGEHRDEPFFLYVAHSMPHVPIYRSRRFEDESLRGRYGDVVEELDANVGRLLAEVERMGLDEKTLIVFTSDNGPWIEYGFDAGSAGLLRGSKGTNYEGGVRVPFVARWPGQIAPGNVSSEIAANLDILPTFAKLAGAAPPTDRTIDGRDIWKLLSEPGAEGPRDSFFYFAGGMKYRAEDGPPKNDPTLEAVRSGKWKLFVSPGGRDEDGAPDVEPGALYNLLEDPSERTDMAEKEPEVVERLRKMAKNFNNGLRMDTRPHGTLAPLAQ
ncbi:MAG: sulfatase [Bryobacterales bacterium]|nr:sulfatase [Bryobacterales bacterium]